jgi:hypothetical protein
MADTNDTEADWFQDTSPETIKKEREDRSSSFARKNQRRVWLPPPGPRGPGGEFEGVFLDDNPRAIHEHSLFLNGSRKGNWFTCIKKLDNRDKPALKPFWGGCPLCQSGDEAYYIAFLTVLDTTGFVISRGKDRGKEVKNFRKLLPLKLDGVEWLNKEKKIRKSLIGAKYHFSRTKKQQAVYGEASYMDKVDLNADEFKYTSDKDGKVYEPTPYEYGKILAPLSRNELLSIVQQMKQQSEAEKHGARPKGGAPVDEEEGYANGADDEIPFALNGDVVSYRHERRKGLAFKF